VTLGIFFQSKTFILGAFLTDISGFWFLCNNDEEEGRHD
jgi:hypothetical protein